MSSGFSFGANKPAEAPAFGQQAFGAQQTTAPPFGTMTTNTATLPQFSSTFGAATTGGFQLSSPAVPSSSTFSTPSFNFNNPSAQPTLKPTTLNFGSATTTSQSQNLFGSPSVSTPNTSSLFGTPKSTLSFNAPAPTSVNTAYAFGSPAASSVPTGGGGGAGAGGGLFGTASATTAASGFPFSLSSTTKPAPTFGSTTTTQGFNFAGAGVAPTTGTNLTYGAAVATVPSTGMTFATTSAAPSSGGLGFGAISTAPTTGLSFGMTPTGPTTGLTFGPTSAGPTTGISFGTASAAPSTGISYGTASAAPTTGISFGTAATAPTTGISFGTASSTAQPTGIAFGTLQSTTNTGLPFGTAPTTQSTGLSYAPATTQSTGITFSAASTVPNTGLSFGATPVPPKLSFGTTAVASSTPASTGGILFGAVKATAPTGIAAPFGATTAVGTALTFSTPAPTSAPTLSFSTPLTSTTAPALNFSTSLAKPAATAAIGITTTTAAASATTTATTSSGFGFGQNLTSTTATSTPSIGLGGIKLPTTITTSGFNLLAQPTIAAAATPTTAATSSTQQNVGLGGVSAMPKQPPTTTATEQAETAPKDQPLPNELLQTVEHFKKYVQEQKSFSSEIARFSVRDLKKVEGDIDLLNNYINELENDMQKNKAMAEKLKGDAAKGLQHMEMAQRTYDTPAGLQYDNTAPLDFFIEVTDNFEKDMYGLKVHIENIDKCIRNTGPPETLTSQDLALGMRRLHETFVALAGRLQSVHNQVELQKEQYLNLRKQTLNDYTNVFEERNKKVETFEILDKVPYQPPTLYTGPTPFNSFGNSQAQALAQNLPPSYPGTNIATQTASGFNMGGPSTIPLFGSNISSGTSSFFNPSSSFQLQKPPVGNKRGKQ